MLSATHASCFTAGGVTCLREGAVRHEVSAQVRPRAPAPRPRARATLSHGARSVFRGGPSDSEGRGGRAREEVEGQVRLQRARTRARPARTHLHLCGHRKGWRVGRTVLTGRDGREQRKRGRARREQEAGSRTMLTRTKDGASIHFSCCRSSRPPMHPTSILNPAAC